MPEKSGKSAIPCAIPTVNGFRKALEKPMLDATYTISIPMKASYPIDTASGTTMPTNGMVSSLMPNTAPASENSTVMAARTSLSRFPTRAMNRPIPAVTAPVAFSSQKAPPTTRMKMMMPACFTNP